MTRYYTRVCNFYYGTKSKNLVEKNKSLPLHGIKRISFDQIEIITRKSKKIVAYGENEEEVFLGRSVARQQNMSEETAQKVDSEIRKIVDKGYERARKVLTEKIDDLHKLAKALLTYETLSGEEIENLINKNVYPKDKEDIKVEDNDKGSALSSLGLKPKIVH